MPQTRALPSLVAGIPGFHALGCGLALYQDADRKIEVAVVPH